MSKSRVDGESAAVSEVVAVPELKAAPVALPVPAGSVESIGPARVFRDKVFTSRTLIMPSGIQLPVVASRVTACGDDQYAFLKAHPELEQLQE